MGFAGITKSSEVGHEVCTKHTHLMQTGICYLPWLLLLRKLMLGWPAEAVCQGMDDIKVHACEGRQLI